jgi:hypothetical protein
MAKKSRRRTRISSGRISRGGKSRGRKSRGRKSRGRTSRGGTSRGGKSRGRKSRGRKSRGRISRGRISRGRTAPNPFITSDRIITKLSEVMKHPINYTTKPTIQFHLGKKQLDPINTAELSSIVAHVGLDAAEM